MSALEPPSWNTVRPATSVDADEIAALQNAVNVAEVGFRWTTPDQVRDDLTAPNHDPDDDLLLVGEDGSLADRGVPAVELGVDAAGPTGATAPYEGVGIRAAHAFEVSEKDLGEAP